MKWSEQTIEAVAKAMRNGFMDGHDGITVAQAALTAISASPEIKGLVDALQGLAMLDAEANITEYRDAYFNAHIALLPFTTGGE